MMSYGRWRRIPLFSPVFWGMVLIALSLGCLGAAKTPTERQDAALDRQDAKTQMAQAQEELAALQSKLYQDDGERANTLIRLAQACWLLGELAEPGSQLDHFERGKYYAEILLREQPGWADGYYWLGLNLCGIAEVGGAGRALRILPDILAALEKAAAIDPTYDQAGPHRVLGRIYCEAPPWPISVGDLHKSLHHLKLAVQIASDNTTNHLYLADTLLRLDKVKEAQAELDKVLKSSKHALWPRGVEQDRRAARQLLVRMNSR